MLDHVMKDINAAKDAELLRIKQNHGETYASIHEAYGVLAEEMHEAELEYVCAKDFFADLIESIHQGAENDDRLRPGSGRGVRAQGCV